MLLYQSHHENGKYFDIGSRKEVGAICEWELEGTDMLVADKRDYRRGYKKHYELYKKLCGENANIHSRRMLLAYSVECGLKYLLLDRWHEENPKRILEGNDKEKKGILKSHNLEKILKELGQQGNFRFVSLETIHKDLASSEEYHQLYRYCIRTQENEHGKEQEMEKI